MPNAALRTALYAIQLLPLALQGQNMSLTGATLTVENGTRVELEGPIIWTIAPSATVINNGRIDLGEFATVVEPDGGPISGGGTEHALYGSTDPATNVEPGGLGLSLSITDPLGNMEIVRGHTVQLDGSSAESIARWFNVLCAPVPGASIDIGFRYDLAELNGLLETDLLLHSADQLTGPWTAMIGTSDLPAHSILSSWSSPWGFITAFDEDITMGVEALSPVRSFLVWPSITQDVVHIRPSAGYEVLDITLVDASGHVVEQAAGAAGERTLSLAMHPPGMYLLRVNGTHAFRIVRQ